MSLYDDLGGEAALRRIVDRFVERLFADPMIGFFFARANKERIKDKEFEFAAEHLGGGVAYTGRPITAAHSAHQIFDGQFLRRLQILRETLDEFDVPEHVRKHWIEHTLSQRSALVQGPCNPDVKE